MPTRRPVRLRAAAVLALTGALGALSLTALETGPLGATSAEAATWSVVPVADATVSGDANYTNFGTSKSLEVDASPIKRSYLQFSVGATSAPLTRAVLRLYPTTSNAAGITVRSVVGNNWTETGIVFANANGLGDVLGSTGPVKAGHWTNVDVSRLVTGPGTYSFVVTSDDGAVQAFSSRQAKAKPQLSLETGTSTTTTPSPTATTAAPSPSPTATTSTTTTVASPSPTATTTATASPSPTTTNRKLLIHHGWDLPTPGQVRNNAALIDSRPFDGITVNLPTLSSDTFSATPHALSEYTNALSPMPALTKVTHNFVIMRVHGASYSFTNDTQWATIAQNAANLAAATRANGKFDGILFDTEYYGSGTAPWNYGTSTIPWTYSSTSGATPGMTQEAARALVHRRGKQVSDAIYAAWPNATVMTTYGPWVGETKTASTGFAGTGYNDTAWANELMGAFTVGMVESAAAAPYGEYVDGGELYQARTATQYQAAHAWIKSGLANSGSVLVPSTLKPAYPANVTVSFGVFDRDMLTSGWPVMTPSAYGNQLTLALKQADRFAWSYNEAYDWLGTGWPTTPVPAEWITATQNARNAANG